MLLPVLMPHQEEGVRFLERHGGCALLAFAAGTGKTLTALEYVRRTNAFPLLILAPVSVLGMWVREIEKYYGWKTVLVHGPKGKREKAYASHAAVYVMGFECMRNDYGAVSKLPVKAIIADETYKIKTPTAKVSKCFRALQPPVRIALDGNPLINSLADFWNVSEWIKPGVFLGSWWAFRKRFAIPSLWIPGKIEGWREPEYITQTANQNILWKKKEDVLKDLPPKTETDLLLEPSKEEKRIYQKLKEELRIEFEGQEFIATNALALLTRLRQAANSMFSEEVGTKTKAVIELFETLPLNEKVVIFSQFETVVSKLAATLPFSCVKVTGQMSQKEREDALSSFKDDKSVRAIIMTSAGERGICLDVASYLIQFDLAFTSASEEQRISRVWRNMQTKPVTVNSLLMAGAGGMHILRIV